MLFLYWIFVWQGAVNIRVARHLYLWSIEDLRHVPRRRPGTSSLQKKNGWKVHICHFNMPYRACTHYIFVVCINNKFTHSLTYPIKSLYLFRTSNIPLVRRKSHYFKTRTEERHQNKSSLLNNLDRQGGGGWFVCSREIWKFAFHTKKKYKNLHSWVK